MAAPGPRHTAVAHAAARLAAEPADHRFKGLPPDAAAAGTTLGELAAERRSLFTGGFTTPVLALSAERLDHNLAALSAYTSRHGLAFAPHGKTSMAPQLFARQIEQGAWGITLAVPHQVRVARAFDVPRIFLANELVDASALRWLAAELDGDPSFRFVCYVDSVQGVALMDEALRAAGARRPVDVVVELGAGAGARTGVRTEEECAAVADAVAATATLRLVGVAGYEGEVPGATLEAVGEWLRRLIALATAFDEAGRFEGLDEIVLSAGGSAWFDAVAEAFAQVPEMSAPVLKLLRSGAYVSHDDGHYRHLTPFNRHPDEGALQAAFTLWTQVVSRPEPGQAFVNAGKRDAAHDLELPEAHAVRGLDGTLRSAKGISVTSLSDQHAWLRVEDGVGLEVGEWIGFGMSHPCTIFDKWQVIPVVDADGTVTDLLRTFF
ncbi:amino acid deaminase [Streptomyces tubbatahanensis]|uniref:Amino acid deaminase n=1 Tax=Streptomyces tubbatahanensis TaxID=2923272 RepID=A0ABY3XW05_9ACTN|nr:alanine racemase [Streptomyces tubbatahanensis]UNS98683.1 amino acid deaminase [Streptomyces tubbatahanensis]